MYRKKTILLTAGILVFVFTNLHAQEAEHIQIKTGEQIRVSTRHDAGHHIIGNIQSLDADSLIIQVERREEITGTYIIWHKDRIAVARSAVTRVEVKKNRILPGRGALAGMGAGFASGLVYALMSEGYMGGDVIRVSEPQYVTLFTIIGGVIGGIIDHRSGSWKPVQLEQVHLGISPWKNGEAGLTLSLKF